MRLVRLSIQFLVFMWFANFLGPEAQAELCAETMVHLGDQEAITVYASNDAGAYYCEHAFCVNAMAAEERDKIGTDRSGDKLVGFMHIERDQFIGSREARYSQSERHVQSRVLVAAAIKGYFLSLIEQSPKNRDITILVTAFGEFLEVKNNPTEDFLNHPENIAAAMHLAFGSHVRAAPSYPGELRYQIQVGNAPFYEVVIQREVLPTDDSSMSRHLPSAIKRFDPHAIISLGVGPEHRIETRISDGGLVFLNNQFVHDDDKQPTFQMHNFSLWNAVQRSSPSTQKKTATF